MMQICENDILGFAIARIIPFIPPNHFVYFFRALQTVPRRHNSFYNSTEFRVHELNKRLQQRTEVNFLSILKLFHVSNNIVHQNILKYLNYDSF